MKPAKGISNEVVEHWYSLVPSQNFSSKEFYEHIEAAVKAQEVPALAASRIDLSEGGALSAKREYLRFKRERLTFDVCAAPVGINYFFSYRFYAEPAVVKAWQILAAMLILGALFVASIRFVDLILGPFLLLIACGYLVWLMRSAVGMGLRDLDSSLLNLPILGPIYEAYFRKDSYYRQDVRIAYCSIVSGIVKQEVARITGEKGVKLLREFTYSPVWGELYKAKETSVSSAFEAEPVSA
jgi:hypothetical protein